MSELENLHTDIPRRRGPGMTGMTGRGGSVSMKDIKVVDMTMIEFNTASPVSPTNNTNKTKSTSTTDLSSSNEERQMRINRAQDHIHKQQMKEDQRQKEKQQELARRSRSRSLSRPRELLSGTRNRGRDDRPASFTKVNSASKDSSLTKAKALLEQMEQKEKTAASSTSSRGRSKSRTRNRSNDLGVTIEKLVDDANRHRSRSRPPQQQHKRDVNQHQKHRSSRSRSCHPPSNDARLNARSRSRPREKKSDHGKDRRRWSEWDTDCQYRGSIQSDKGGKEHSEKELRKYVQVEQQKPKQRRSSKRFSREEHQQRHQHDRIRAESRDGRRPSKSPVAKHEKHCKTSRSKSPYRRDLKERSAITRSKSPYKEKKNCSNDRDDKTLSSCSSSSYISRDCYGDIKPRRIDENGCCIYHPFIQLRRKSGGEWIILSRLCAMCNKQAQKRGDNMKRTIEEESVVFVPGGLTDELPRRNGGRSSMVKQRSAPSMSNWAGGECSLTIGELESDDSSSSSFASTDTKESEDDNNSFKSKGKQKKQSHQNLSGSMLVEPMCTEMSVSEGSSERIESGNLGKTTKIKSEDDEEKNLSPRGKGSSRNTKTSNDVCIDMSKVESALKQIRSRTPPPTNRGKSVVRTTSDAVDSGKPRTPPPSHPKLHAAKQQQSPQQSRPPPPPPPPYQYGQSMAVLNFDPEPEWIESDEMHSSSMHHMHTPAQEREQSYKLDLQHMPNKQQDQASNDKETEWTKYAVKCSTRREDGPKNKERRKSKISGKVPEKLDNNDRQVHLAVKNMPFTDTIGDFGIYTGQVNESGRPDGKGTMKYDNGIFYEGTWTNGCQDEKAVSQYDRIRGGFTSWGGKGKVAVKSGRTMPWNATKNDKNDDNVTTNVRGMEWVDMNGDSGRYTGEVNKENIPHGRGIMKYSYGLIAEGEWVWGVLKENPHDRMIAAASAGGGMSVVSGARSLGLGGGMSVGPGMSASMSVGPLRPPIFVGGGMSVAQGSVYNGMPHMMMQPQVMTMQMQPQPNNIAQQHSILAQQNAMLNGICSPTGSLYGSQKPMVPQQAHQVGSKQNTNAPPVLEITLG